VCFLFLSKKNNEIILMKQQDLKIQSVYKTKISLPTVQQLTVVDYCELGDSLVKGQF
jgi:hypothetical protein